MDEIIILETSCGVFLDHYDHHYHIKKLILTDFSDKVRVNDIYLGRILRLEGPRIWIDIGTIKAALMKQGSKKFNVGEKIGVQIENVGSGNKGARVTYKNLQLEKIEKQSYLSTFGKIYASPQEWYQYLKEISHPLNIRTNSFNIFQTLQKDFTSPVHKIILKTDLKPEFDSYLSWTSVQESRYDMEEGGYIIFEEIETLTAIDINTSQHDYFQKDFIHDHHWLEFNQRCGRLVMQQIILRNISGLIVIDFPRMKDRKHQQMIYQTIQKEVDQNTQVLGWTRAGLFELTRKKQQNSLSKRLKKGNLWSSFQNLYNVSKRS